MYFLSIRRTVPLAVLIPLLVCVGLTGWIAFFNGRQAVGDLVMKKSMILNEHVKERLHGYLAIPPVINQANADQIELEELDLQNAQRLERHLWFQLQRFNDVDVIEFGYQQDGQSVGAVRLENKALAIEVANPSTGNAKVQYAVNDQGEQGQVLARIPTYDVRQQSWYQQAVKLGKPLWTEPSLKPGTQLLRVAAVHPVYDKSSRELVGVLSVNFFLDKISEFLQDLRVSDAEEVFIVDSGGYLIAASDRENLLTGSGAQMKRTAAIASPERHIQEISRYVNDKWGGFSQMSEAENLKDENQDESFELTVDRERYLVHVTRFTDKLGLNWWLVVAVPEKEFLKGLEATTRFSIFLGVGAVICSAALGILASRWLVRPIVRLNTAANQIKSRTFSPTSITDLTQRADEVGELAQVFLDMAEVIDTREQSLEDQVRLLRNESDKAKKAALASKISGGTVNLAALLEQSKRIRLQSEYEHVNVADLLRRVSYFQGLTNTEIQELVDLGYKKPFNAGQIVCQEDEPGNTFYILLSGEVEVYVAALNKRLTTLTTGDFFGELSLLLGIPRTATVKTLEPTIAFVVDQAGLRTLLQEHQQLGDQIAQKLNQHKAELQQRQEILRKHGIVGDEALFRSNFLGWVKQRMNLLFST